MLKSKSQYVFFVVLLCATTVAAGDTQGQLSESDRAQIAAAIDKHWPVAEIAALQDIGSRKQYRVDTIKLVTSKPELFAVVEFEERRITDTRGQLLTVTCRMRVEWQCGSPLAHHYVHWAAQEQRIYLNVGVDEDVALDAFSYVTTMTGLTTDDGHALLSNEEHSTRQKPIIRDISKTGRGDLLVTVTNRDGSKTGRVFVRPGFDATSARSFSTIDGNTYRSSLGE